MPRVVASATRLRNHREIVDVARRGGVYQRERERHEAALKTPPADLRVLSLRYGNPLPEDQIASFIDDRAATVDWRPRSWIVPCHGHNLSEIALLMPRKFPNTSRLPTTVTRFMCQMGQGFPTATTTIRLSWSYTTLLHAFTSALGAARRSRPISRGMAATATKTAITRRSTSPVARGQKAKSLKKLKI